MNHAPGRTVLDAHSIQISPGSLLARLSAAVGTIEEEKVNSSHHQALRTLGGRLRVTAVSPADEVIEAVELDSPEFASESSSDSAHFVLGVQWHPERSYTASPLSPRHLRSLLPCRRGVEAARHSRIGSHSLMPNSISQDSSVPDFSSFAIRLNALLAEAGQLPLDSAVAARFEDYLILLQRWNARTNLTAIRDEEDILRRHFIECIATAHALPFQAGTLLDFGAGAGFPGIPIALCCPEIHVTLAESQGKKTAFLREAVRTLGFLRRSMAIERKSSARPLIV